MSTNRNRVEEKDNNNLASGKDRMPEHKERLSENNAGLKHKLTEKQAPGDTDKGRGGESPEQRQNTTPAGAMERESKNEIGTDKKVKTNDK